MDKELYEYIFNVLLDRGIQVILDGESINFISTENKTDVFYWIDTDMFDVETLSTDLDEQWVCNTEDDSDTEWNMVLSEIKTAIRKYKIHCFING